MDLAGTSQGCTTKATQMPMHPQLCVYVWCVGQTYYWQPLWLLQGCCLGWQAHSGANPTAAAEVASAHPSCAGCCNNTRQDVPRIAAKPERTHNAGNGTRDTPPGASARQRHSVLHSHTCTCASPHTQCDPHATGSSAWAHSYQREAWCPLGPPPPLPCAQCCGWHMVHEVGR